MIWYSAWLIIFSTVITAQTSKNTAAIVAIPRTTRIGETVSVPGGWIGFPAHHHDYERPGKEVVLDEIFPFQMTSEGTGKGGVL